MKIELELNDEQYIKLEQRAKAAGLGAVDELMRKLLDQELTSMASDEKEIADQLESLGYM